MGGEDVVTLGIYVFYETKTKRESVTAVKYLLGEKNSETLG